jgi:hypothetical protein
MTPVFRSRTLLTTAVLTATLYAACAPDARTPAAPVVSMASQMLAPTTTAYTFKIRLKNGQWHALQWPSDFLMGRNHSGCSNPTANGFRFKEQGHGYDPNQVYNLCPDSIALDSVSVIHDPVPNYQVYGHIPGRFSYLIDPGAASTLMVLQATEQFGSALVYDSVNDDGTLQFDAWNDGGAIVTFSQAHIAADTGAFQFSACNTPPVVQCSLVAPTGATLTNGANALITWSNNGDATDSTEVLFGFVGGLVMRAIVAPGVTQYTLPWSTGTHSYQAKVKHRFGVVAGLVRKSGASFSNVVVHYGGF